MDLLVIILFGVILISCILIRLKPFEKHRKIFGIVFILIPLIIIIVSYFYDETDNIYDFIFINIYFIVLLVILTLLEKKTRENTYSYFGFFIVFYVIMFYSIRIMNGRLLISLNYMVIVLTFITNIKSIYKRDDRTVMIFANIIGIIIIGIMTMIYPKSYLTSTKQERILNGYLINEQEIDDEDIIEITVLSNPSVNNEKRIFVKIKDEGAFIYYYKSGEITGVEEKDFSK
ncbi:hypothetical protein [Vallitalea guaymasensis]|uniref:Uncharacterized protein n=1 Tax=Vallitalea guaymasensis TaxID=1185412 RepID=A0A8J8SE08_9FIRM|nr:hypothetical protein [Vallitalea guaymasensis]QUH31075.1 hypothetical protein HYG85_19985 [Vallitalea guaymasensis]